MSSEEPETTPDPEPDETAAHVRRVVALGQELQKMFEQASHDKQRGLHRLLPDHRKIFYPGDQKMKSLIAFLLLMPVAAFCAELTADSVAVEPSIVDQLVQYAGYVVAVLTALISLYKSHVAGKTLVESLSGLASTLKDEGKMTGGQFNLKTVAKAEAVMKELKASEAATQAVKETLRGKEADIKLVSWNGKKLYLSDALRGFGLVATIRRLFK